MRVCVKLVCPVHLALCVLFVASAPAYEGDPVFELTLGECHHGNSVPSSHSPPPPPVACSSLVGSLRDGVPSAMIVTSCMTPPQAYWIRYAQTEVIEVSQLTHILVTGNVIL